MTAANKVWGGKRGRVKFVTGARGSSRATLAPPMLRDGQQRCPACRNGSSVTSRGYLRRHKDLFGFDCHNVALPEPANSP